MRSSRFLTIPALTLCLAAVPAAAPAQQTPGPSGPETRLPEKLDKALRDMMETMKPALDDLLDTLEVFEQIDSLENYERPEVLPNGDIIIRRRDEAPEWQPPEAPEGKEDGVREPLNRRVEITLSN